MEILQKMYQTAKRSLGCERERAGFVAGVCRMNVGVDVAQSEIGMVHDPFPVMEKNALKPIKNATLKFLCIFGFLNSCEIKIKTHFRQFERKILFVIDFFGRNVQNQINDAIRITKLIVIPAYKLDKFVIEGNTGFSIKNA